MNYKDKVVVVTGGANGIGRCIAERFKEQGASLAIIDIAENPFFVGDIGDKETLERFAEKVITQYGRIDILINNAPPPSKGLFDCGYDEFSSALNIGVTSAFYLTKLFLPHFAEGSSIINISSSRDRMSQAGTESYTAAKGGIAALTHAMAVTLSGQVRVNSVSPGWIDTAYTVYNDENASQHPSGRVGNPDDIANMILFLCSDKAGFITGENICIDGGMTRQMIYHDDCGWKLNNRGENI